MTNYSPRILLTGGHGQLATALLHDPLARDFTIMACSRQELDITQPVAIDNVISKFIPDIIINTAAYTAVDKAEEEAGLADRTNHMGAGQLALACEKNQIKLFHLSTDYIFDGSKDGKYLEDDAACPINIYGKSKWEGEEAIRQYHKNHVILRVSGVFSQYGENILKTFLRLARERTSMKVVSDQITCPTYAGDIASTILTMCKSPSHKGTFHFSSAEAVSWYDFAQAVIDEARKHETLNVNEVQAVSSSEYPTAAIRPHCSVLDCHKINTVYGIAQPSWREAIQHAVLTLSRAKA
jgi:dTDP-4-dehydrorhamnose reductase